MIFFALDRIRISNSLLNGHIFYTQYVTLQVVRRAPTYIIYPGGAMALTYGSIKLAADATAAEDYSHRP